MKAKRYVYAGLLALTVLTGCSNAAQPAQHTGHAGHQEHLPNGDLQEATASISQLPTFLDKVDPQIKEVYRIAGENNELLQSMPCYCGCGESAGHNHNGNCFINEVKSDGTVVWDDHGTRCGVCMEIAFVSSKMKKEGKTDKEIRTFIDEHYKDGYATPTPTPMPS